MNAQISNLKGITGVIILVLSLGSNLACSQDEKKDVSNRVLKEVADIPMPGPVVRFDYQSLDTKHGRLYIAHMNADQLVVFDTEKQQVLANLDGFKRAHGVLAVPEIGRVYASATGEHQVAAVDMTSLKTIAMTGPITYPDGLAYAPAVRRIFVSDEHGGKDAVIDTTSNKLLANIPLGGGAGNTVYDSGSGHFFVAVHDANELVAIDPAAMKIIGRYPLPGIKNPHGIAVDMSNRIAFIAGEDNHTLGVFDLTTMRLLSIHQVGDDPYVLAFDAGLKRLYVAAESGTVTAFDESGQELRPLGQFHMPHVHTVSVDPKSHLIYFPLENVGGRPLLRIMKPADLP
jgi:DNA-binding beta-propeller fold protein YncE